MAVPAPAAAVDPANYSFGEVFSQSELVNSLQVDYSELTHKISDWIDVETTRNGVLDRLSEFLLSSFTTLLDTYEPPEPFRGRVLTGLSTHDVLIVKNKLKEKIRPSLDDLFSVRDTAKYTEFCSNFLGKMTGIDARAILEVLDPDPQCNALVAEKKFCWICGLGLNDEPKPECEHILPITDALFHLNLYQNRSSLERLNKYEVNMLKLEYLWSHQCCNQSKNNLKYITTDRDRYVVNEDGIDTTIQRIRNNAKPDASGSYDCHAIFGEYTDPSTLKGKSRTKTNAKMAASAAAAANIRYKHLSVERISTYIQPIVDTINSHIDYLAKTDTMNQQKAFLVYEYLILIRFFSRIPGCTIVEAFKRYYLSDDAESLQAAAAEEKRLRDEIKRLKEVEDAERAARVEARAEEARRRKEEARQELIRVQQEATQRMRLSISLGKSSADRYAAREAARAKINTSMEDANRIVTITTSDDNKAPVAITEIMDETLDAVTGTTGMLGGARKLKPRKLSADYTPDPIIYKTRKTNTFNRYVIRNRRKFFSEQLHLDENAIKTSIIQEYDNTGDEVNNIIDEIERYNNRKNDLFTDQDIDHLQRLYTIPKIQKLIQSRYIDQRQKITDTTLNRVLHQQAINEEAIGRAVRNDGQQGGTYPNNKKTVKIDPYAIIQVDFTTEKAFVFLLAYYPVYLQINKLRSISADRYMSTPHILRDTLKYFGVDPAEYSKLLMKDHHGVAVSTLPSRPRVVSTQPEQPNYAAFFASLKKNPSHHLPPTRPRVQIESALRQARVIGGKRRTKKCHVVKYRTRKHKKN